MRWGVIVFTFFVGVIFDSLLAPYPGFYFIPSAAAGLTLAYLPIIIDILKAIAALLLGFAIMSLSAFFVAKNMFSMKLFLHFVIYFTFLISISFLIDAATKRQQNRI